MHPHLWTVTETQDALNQGKLSYAELATWYLQRIETYNHSLKAYITVAEDVLDKARILDENRARGVPVGPLAGILVAVKDLFDTAGIPTTYGGNHFADHVPNVSATVVQRLERAGAIIIGKTNLHEYAYGTTTENPHYGNARNPWNKNKIAGGSSGGSSVALAAGLCTAALGTDTGGSIRIPAALCGHVGFKPSYGLVSKAGVFPLAPSLDHVGPMTKSVADAALLLSVMAGPDVRDPSTVRLPVRSYLGTPLQRPIRLGLPVNFFFERCHPSVLQTVHRALQQLQSAGVTLCEVEIPMMSDVPEMQNVVIGSEALAVHEELFETRKGEYGDDVRRRLDASCSIRGSQYVTATDFRSRFRNALKRVFDSVDAVVTPTTGLPATDIGQWKTHVKTLEVNVRAHLTRFTNPWNLSGLPALSVPCGTSPDGLPVGLQLVGPMYSDAKVLQIAARVEAIIGRTTLAPDFR